MGDETSGSADEETPAPDSADEETAEPEPTPVPASPGAAARQHLGCFKDNKKDRVLEHYLSSDMMTTDVSNVLLFGHFPISSIWVMSGVFSTYVCFYFLSRSLVARATGCGAATLSQKCSHLWGPLMDPLSRVCVCCTQLYPSFWETSNVVCALRV